MLTCKLFGWVSVTLVLASPSGIALAQAVPTSDTQPSQIEEIVVTAQKRSQALSDVGLTVNVVNAEQLADRGVVNIADLAVAVPGFTAATNSDGTPIYTLRGVSFNSINFGTAPTVSVYVDEAPVPFAVMSEGALFDISNVQVLKGPQGTLFGQNATGGAVNYSVAKPTDAFEAGIKGTYGRFDTLIGEGYISGPLTNNLNARLAFSGTDSGPWQQSVSRDAQLGSQKKGAARLLLDWRPTDRLHISTNLNGWFDHSDTQAPQFVVARPSVPSAVDPQLLLIAPTTLNARSADWDAGSSFRRNNGFYQGVVRTDYQLAPDAELTSLTTYGHVSINSFSEHDATPLAIQSVRTSGYVEAFDQELRLAGAFPDTGIHYIVGGNFQRDTSFESQNIFIPLNSAAQVPGFGSFSGLDSVGNQSNKTSAAFANTDWDLNHKLTLSGGLRWTHIEHASTGCSRDPGDGQTSAVINGLSSYLRNAFGLPPGPLSVRGGCVTLGPEFVPEAVSQSFGENNLSWRANVNYKPEEGVLLYGTVSRGFKGGNFPIAPASSYTSLAPVRQEELTSYEAGTKLRLFDRKLSINAAGFYYDYKDKQLLTNTEDPIFGLLFAVRNIPKSTVRGFDADVTWKPIASATLRTAVTYANSKVGAYQGFDVFGTPTSLTGHPFNLAPKWISVNDAEYRHSLATSLEGYVGASVVYNSKTYADLADSPSLKIRQFTTLDLRAGVAPQSDKWQVMVFAHNVTNVYYWNYAEAGGDSVLRYASQPRTYGVTAGYKF